jgi:hypothetical protein
MLGRIFKALQNVALKELDRFKFACFAEFQFCYLMTIK